MLSTEAIQAVQSLKLAKSSMKLEEVFSSKVSRLLKSDLLDTLAELQRQREFELTLKVRASALISDFLRFCFPLYKKITFLNSN